MTAKMPPVPPANRSKKGPDATSKPSTKDAELARKQENKPNLEQEGRHGNIHQNTHNQGYQQDR